jgi:hypothetical protein
MMLTTRNSTTLACSLAVLAGLCSTASAQFVGSGPGFWTLLQTQVYTYPPGALVDFNDQYFYDFPDPAEKVQVAQGFGSAQARIGAYELTASAESTGLGWGAGARINLTFFKVATPMTVTLAWDFSGDSGEIFNNGQPQSYLDFKGGPYFIFRDADDPAGSKTVNLVPGEIYELSGAVYATGELGFSSAGMTGECRADCNGDGTLSILDFVCFQGLVQSGDGGADCNEDGVVNILDFVCFQDLFVAGCD